MKIFRLTFRYHDGEKLKGPLGQKARQNVFQVSYEHDSQCVLMLIDELCWHILNGVHRTFFHKNILVWLRIVLSDWRTVLRGPQKYANFSCYFSIKLKNCLSHAIKYYWEAEWYSNCDHYILLDLKNIKNNCNMFDKFAERDLESKIQL